MKSVTIVGQFYPDLEQFDWDYQYEFGEIWMLNAFFDYYPKASPDRIYQIHAEDTKNLPSIQRMEQVYNNYDAIVKTSYPHGGRIKNESIIDKKFYEDKYGVENLSCTICIMFYEAIEYGAEEITLLGVFLNSREYKYQAPGIIKAIKTAREKGIKVYIDQIREWELFCKAEDALKLKIHPSNGYWNMMSNHPKESLFK